MRTTWKRITMAIAGILLIAGAGLAYLGLKQEPKKCLYIYGDYPGIRQGPCN